MEQNSPKDQKIIKIVAKRPGKTVPSGVIPGESFSTIPCYTLPMVNSLEKPIPIPKSRKKKRE
jgi:hypothetical protein